MLLLEIKLSWFHVIVGNQTCKVNTTMEQYTAKQWAEIEGGHTMSQYEEKKLKLDFIGKDLNESKMFRSKNKIEGTSNRDMADFVFMNMLTLYILSVEYEYAAAAKGYATKTMMYGGFTNFKSSATDLYQGLTSVKTGASTAREKDKLQQQKLKLSDQKIKQFLNYIRRGQKVVSPQAFFLSLERDLDIQNSNYRSVRRLAQDWTRLNQMQKQLAMTRLMQYFRTNALRSELYPLVKDMSRSQKLEIKNAHNAEKPKWKSSDAVAATAAMAAAGAAGFYAGRGIGRLATGYKGD